MPDRPPLASPQADYRRVLGMFRVLEQGHDDFERIEIVSTICAAIRQLLTAERSVLFPLYEASETTETAMPDVHERQAGLLLLVRRLESLSPEEPGFPVTVRQTYDLLREYVCINERELLPRLASQAAPGVLHGAEQQWRDLQERMTEH